MLKPKTVRVIIHSICICIAVALLASLAYCETITVPMSLNKVPDINKTWDNDSQLCWAAVASNMLASSFNPNAAKSFYTSLKKKYKNEPDSIYTGLKYILTVNDIPTDGLMSWTSIDYSNLELWIKGALLKDEVVGIGVYEEVDNDINMAAGHALTVYGYKKDNNGNRYILYVDSDDDKSTLYTERIDNKGKYLYFKGRLNNYRIENAISLQIVTKEK